jgi:hypothetical protein
MTRSLVQRELGLSAQGMEQLSLSSLGQQKVEEWSGRRMGR